MSENESKAKSFYALGSDGSMMVFYLYPDHAYVLVAGSTGDAASMTMSISEFTSLIQKCLEATLPKTEERS